MPAHSNWVESNLDPGGAAFRQVVESGCGFSRRLNIGDVVRIVDLNGNQAVDTLFYDALDLSNRYSSVDTIREQGNVFLTTGSRLLTLNGDVLMTIVADTCGRHDTLGGACSAESNQVRYALDRKHMHNCRDTFLLEIGHRWPAMSKRDLSPNINFFMNVPVTPEGGLRFADGVSAPMRYVELRAEREALILISNCPQLNNPCNAYNPTPIEVVIWKGQG